MKYCEKCGEIHPTKYHLSDYVKREVTDDAVEILYNRYVKGDSEILRQLKEIEKEDEKERKLFEEELDSIEKDPFKALQDAYKAIEFIHEFKEKH